MPNSFGAYLDAKDLLQRPAEPIQRPAAPADSSVPTSRALDLLLNAEFPSPVPKLLDESGLPLEEFTETLNTLNQAGLVKLSKAEADSREVAALTEQGLALRSS